MGSSSRSKTETRYDQRSSNSTIGQELSDQAVGVVGDGNNVNYQVTDHGAMDLAETAFFESMNFARDNQNAANDTVNNAIISNENVTSDALAFGSDAASNALISNENVTRDALGFGSDTVGEALISNENVTRDALAANESVANNSVIAGENMLNDSLMFGGDVFGGALATVENTTTDAINFGRDAVDAVSFNAAESINAQLEASGMMGDLANNALLSSEIMLGDSLMFAGEQNQLLADTLGDNAEMTQTALLTLADNQERGLNSALDVASSVALDDNVEGATEQTKYFALAIAAVGVALAFRG